MIFGKNSARNYEKKKYLEHRRLVDEAFVPANQQTSVLYCRLSDFWITIEWCSNDSFALSILIFENSSLKTQVQRTGFLTYKNQFWNGFLQATQAVKIQFVELDFSNLSFPTWFFRNQVQMDRKVDDPWITLRWH